ncbi:peptide chain release factor N(5)-glutamine methyltransferase [soil metagenome]
MKRRDWAHWVTDLFRAADLIRAGEQLSEVSDTPRLDAELLLAHALGITREALILGGQYEAPPGFAALIARRMAHEPVAYILGTRDFWSITLRVTPDVLIPRPDSETLIEAALAHFGPTGPGRILDLGTGSGALLLAALTQWPNASGLGIDASPAALAVATGNADCLGLSTRARFAQGDWASGIGEKFDLLLINPPYIESAAMLERQVSEFEPASALFAGSDGLADYRRIVPTLPDLLSPGGIACIEIGSTQRMAVTELLEAEGLSVTTAKDLGGHDRCLIAARK